LVVATTFAVPDAVRAQGTHPTFAKDVAPILPDEMPALPSSRRDGADG
jgi:hypothetical protein